MSSGGHELRGVQTPRFSFAPRSVSNAAPETIALCAQLGMPLDEWQGNALTLMLGERADGTWASFEFGLIVARQNGKGGVLEARELAGLFLFGEKHIIHSAHEEGTAAEAYLRMYNLIDSTPWLYKHVKKMNGAPGKQRIELKSGQRLSYRTRTSSGGRGFSGSPIILDEAQNLTSRQIAALMPVAAAQANPQLIYAGTVLPEATTFRGIVERGRKKIGKRLGYAEWSAPDEADEDAPETWAIANPALGIRISVDYVQAERESLVAAGAAAEFSQERLSKWPDASAQGSLISIQAWEDSLNKKGTLPQSWEEAIVGVAVSPKRDWSSVAAAFTRPDGKTYVEVVQHEPGTDWLLPYLVGLNERRGPKEIVLDSTGPGATLLASMISAGLNVRVTDTAAYKSACATFVDAANYKKIQHRGQPELTEAAYGVKERKVGDSWVYARRDSGVLVAPLEAVTLAFWGLSPDPKKKEFFMLNLNDFVTK